MRGPSTQPLPLLLSNSGNQTQTRCQGDNERMGGTRGHAADITRLRSDHQHGDEKYYKKAYLEAGKDMLAMTDDPWLRLRLRMVVVGVCQEVVAM